MRGWWFIKVRLSPQYCPLPAFSVLSITLSSSSISQFVRNNYNDVIMGTMASQITSLTIVHWTVYSDADQRKHQSSKSLAFVRGIHRWPVNSPHKGPVTRKMFPFDDVIMSIGKIHIVDEARPRAMTWVRNIYPTQTLSYSACGVIQKCAYGNW